MRSRKVLIQMSHGAEWFELEDPDRLVRRRALGVVHCLKVHFMSESPEKEAGRKEIEQVWLETRGERLTTESEGLWAFLRFTSRLMVSGAVPLLAFSLGGWGIVAFLVFATLSYQKKRASRPLGRRNRSG